MTGNKPDDHDKLDDDSNETDSEVTAAEFATALQLIAGRLEHGDQRRPDRGAEGKPDETVSVPPRSTTETAAAPAVEILPLPDLDVESAPLADLVGEPEPGPQSEPDHASAPLAEPTHELEPRADPGLEPAQLADLVPDPAPDDAASRDDDDDIWMDPWSGQEPAAPKRQERRTGLPDDGPAFDVPEAAAEGDPPPTAARDSTIDEASRRAPADPHEPLMSFGRDHAPNAADLPTFDPPLEVPPLSDFPEPSAEDTDTDQPASRPTEEDQPPTSRPDAADLIDRASMDQPLPAPSATVGPVFRSDARGAAPRTPPTDPTGMPLDERFPAEAEFRSTLDAGPRPDRAPDAGPPERGTGDTPTGDRLADLTTADADLGPEPPTADRHDDLRRDPTASEGDSHGNPAGPFASKGTAGPVDDHHDEPPTTEDPAPAVDRLTEDDDRSTDRAVPAADRPTGDDGWSTEPTAPPADRLAGDDWPAEDPAPPADDLTADRLTADREAIADRVATAARAESVVDRVTDDDQDHDVALDLDRILPPMADGRVDVKAVQTGRRKGDGRAGATAFWLLIAMVLGASGYWAFRDRAQFGAVRDWAMAIAQRAPAETSDTAGPAPTQPPPAVTEAADVAESATPDGATLPPAGETGGAADSTPPTQERRAEVTVALGSPTETVADPVATGRQPAPEGRAGGLADLADVATIDLGEPAETSTTDLAVVAPPPSADDAVRPVEPPVDPGGSELAARQLDDLPDDVRDVARRAADGDSAAQHELANLYAVGDRIPQDLQQAGFWYDRAADAGIVNARYNLGVLTLRGNGVPQDDERAFRMFLEAAEAGHPDAQNAVGLAYATGTGVEADALQAASWFQAATANGYPRGAYHLGTLFEYGLDGAPDMAAAAGWYRIAADAGDERARAALERVTAAASPPPAAPLPQPAEPTVPVPAATPEPVPPTPTQPLAQPSQMVMDIQQALNRLGYDAGPVDGFMGGKTRSAIREFQQARNMFATGEPSRGLLAVISLEADD